MIEDHKRLVSRIATFQSALDAMLGSIMAQDERTEARLTTLESDHKFTNDRIERLITRVEDLESRPCSPASPAPSETATSGKDSPTGCTTSAPSPSSPESSWRSSSPREPDPSAAIRADPKRPGWLKDSMLPLPVGTERVYKDREVLRAYPPGKWWCLDAEKASWNLTMWTEQQQTIDVATDVYHVPQPAPADKPTILPPAEIAAHAKELGWTPESRVYGNERCFSVFPSGMCLWRSDNTVFENGATEDEDRDNGYTILPNRTITTETILGTESAAKAVEQGVADVVEGRTVPIAVYGYCPICGAIGVNRERRLNGCDQCEKGHLYPSKDAVPTKPKPNPAQHKLAAEAQEEGERAKASSTPSTPRRSAREVAEWVVDHAQDLYAKDGGTLLFSARQAIRQAALAAIERDREGR